MACNILRSIIRDIPPFATATVSAHKCKATVLEKHLTNGEFFQTPVVVGDPHSNVLGSAFSDTCERPPQTTDIRT